jgi:hypothetical protein
MCVLKCTKLFINKFPYELSIGQKEFYVCTVNGCLPNTYDYECLYNDRIIILINTSRHIDNRHILMFQYILTFCTISNFNIYVLLVVHSKKAYRAVLKGNGNEAEFPRFLHKSVRHWSYTTF